MAASPPPAGIYVPVPTFFASAPTPSSPTPPTDLPTQLQHGLHLARNGIRGLVLLGSTGETISLSIAERSELLAYMREGFAKADFKNYPLIAGTTGQGVDEVLTELKSAKDAGAGWGMVLAPGYFAAGGGAVGIQQWYEAVADKSPIPIMIYHYPGVSNNLVIPPSTFATLAQHPNIVGCKLSHGNLSHTAQIASHPSISPNHFATFTGLGQQLLPVLSVGGAGAIDGLAGMFPRSVVKLYNMYVSGSEGKREEMRKVQYKISAAEEMIVKLGVPGIKEGARKVLGMGVQGAIRWPHVGAPSDSEWKEFEEPFAEMASLEKSYRWESFAAHAA